ncbi:MAG: rhamnogalacturonan acetylesterase [Anaerocolumna sp.]
MANRIFWASDSTVKHNRIISYPQTGIGQVMNLYLKPEVQIYNHAENGRSTKSFINEKRLDEINALIGEKDYLFIQFGHNDQKEDVERHTEPFGDYQENLTKYIMTAKEHGAYPVLITPVYRRHFIDGTLVENVHMEYPKAMIELGEKMGVPVIDLCEKSRVLLERTGDADSIPWFMHLKENEFKNYPKGLEDNTHLRYEGAVAMAELLAEGLRELGGIYSDLLLI